MRFLLGLFALLFVTGEVPLDFEFLCAEQGVEVQFTHLVLVDKGLEFGFETYSCCGISRGRLLWKEEEREGTVRRLLREFCDCRGRRSLLPSVT